MKAKYVHTTQDGIEDEKQIREFTLKFNERFHKVLDIKFKNLHTLNERVDILNQSQSQIFLDHVLLESKYLKINSNPFIIISTGINENGIDSTGRIGRTYSIQFELFGKKRKYRAKNWFDERVFKFYCYAESIEEILNKFQIFVDGEYKLTTNYIRNAKAGLIETNFW